MQPAEVRADFSADPASAGQARRFVDATLRSWQYDQLVDIATLLVSELVSNAILHAGTTIRVAIRRADDRVRIEVHDGNSRGPARKHYSATATTGRGLLLVEELSDRWGVARATKGKTVWFELGRMEAEAERAAGAVEPREVGAPRHEGARGAGRSDAGTEPRLRAGVGSVGP